jgi:hypothetical protein
MSLADITSDPTVLQSLTSCSYELSWTGAAPIGTASIQFSNDYSLGADGKTANAGNWVTATLSLNGAPVSSIPISGSPGNAFIDIDKTAAYAVRLVYTKTSGTGTLKATVNAKVS